ncbi:hypothetical protein BTW07_10295 [Salinicola socius]|uniref:Glycosyl transferase n=2 Tax=Salinicola socius TaxID=404433 RepID=A0A1Q8SS62_9GAMM|nr:hypothetical protein BTW07_10295 [Salinicola socius]
MGLLAPTALALDSALRTTAISQIEILGVSLTANAESILRRVAENREVPIRFHAINESAFAGVGAKGSHVPNAALARLYLPQLVDGRVLYIDGDTLVRRDVGDAFRMSMNGHCIAGVRDFSTLKKEVKFQSGRSWVDRARVGDIVAPLPVESYINSGVLLIDCGAIRRERGLAEAMLDFEYADRYPLVDQDYINELFKGRILHLNPSWNASWGRQKQQVSWTRELGYSGDEVKREPARIVHYHGAEKPWRKLPRNRWKRSFSGVLAYRIALRNFQKRFPEVSFDR